MKKIYLLYFVLLSFATTAWVGCSDWTEPKAKDYFKATPEDYYAALRNYKKTDHQVAFGWFGNWTGEGASLVNCLNGIPDSMDIVSIWGGWTNLTPEKKADLEFCQQKKGTKFLMCFIVANLGDQLTPDEYKSTQDSIKMFWGWKDDDTTSINNAIRKFANAVCDTIYKYNYDGFDIDYEPHFGNSGNMASYPDRMKTFIEELGKQLGPKSGSGKILAVDGEPQSIAGEAGPYFDYFIIQSYNSPGDNNLNDRLLHYGPYGTNALVDNFKDFMSEEEITNKCIMTENFESVGIAMEGGYDFTDQYGKKMKSLEGMARWQPSNGFRKGGCGSYHMEAEYTTNPEYKWMRNAIQIMNPAVHEFNKYESD